MARLVPRALCAAIAIAGVLFSPGVDADTVKPKEVLPGPQRVDVIPNEPPVRQLTTKDEGAAKTPNLKAHAAPRFLGATFDLGFPDGAIIGVAGRPYNWLRLAAGAGTNSISLGVRGGVSIVPFGVGPSVTVEGGRYFDGNANSTVSFVAGSSYEGNPLADRVGYQFANFHAGLELGQERFAVFFHGGMSYIHTALHNANDALGGTTENTGAGSTTVVINGDPTISAWVPSFKLGFIFYLV